jgi:hypothetical protein
VHENGKMRPIETILTMGGKRIIEKHGEGELTKIYVNTFLNVTMHPRNNNNIITKQEACYLSLFAVL